MAPYVRPPMPSAVYRDAAGTVIPYGARWEGSPPDDAYSVTAHPERFAVMHSVAEALVEHLASTFEVTVSEDLAHAADLLHGHPGAVRAVRVTPADRDAAPLTFVFTDFPQVVVHAGALHDSHYPSCGCDACDDDVLYLTEEMEKLVCAVVEGRFVETVSRRWMPAPPWKAAWVASRITTREGDEVGGGGLVNQSGALRRARASRPRLARLTDGWKPWPTLPR